MRILILVFSFLLGTIFCSLVEINQSIVIEEKIEQPKESIKPIELPIEPPIEPEKPKISPTAKGLIEAGKIYPGANVCKSEMHPLLMKLAAEQANYQARVGVQGHQNFNSRFNTIQQAGFGLAAEICAESWPWQANDSINAIGWEMFKCWNQSSGHWSIACKQHKYFGADMAKGRNGVYYACIIVVD